MISFYNRSLRTALTFGRKCSPLQNRLYASTDGGKTMKQVEVDDPETQKKLGNLQMNTISRAERVNTARANDFRKSRRNTTRIGLTLLVMIFGIYSYTLVAVKQEKFLDDFEYPDPLEEKPTRAQKGSL